MSGYFIQIRRITTNSIRNIQNTNGISKQINNNTIPLTQSYFSHLHSHSNSHVNNISMRGDICNKCLETRFISYNKTSVIYMGNLETKSDFAKNYKNSEKYFLSDKVIG